MLFIILYSELVKVAKKLSIKNILKLYKNYYINKNIYYNTNNVKKNYISREYKYIVSKLLSIE